jgi:SSS family solute:Na+ symporter
VTHLSTVDLIIVAGYILGTMLLGARLSRRQRDVNSYFVSDRNVGWWLVLISIVATETSTVTFLSVPGLSFNPQGGNLTFLQLSFGYIIGRIVIAWLLLPAYLSGNLLSAYQLLRQRFSPAVQRTASAIFLLTRMIADGLRLYLAALLVGQFTGWNATWSVIGTAAVTIVYTYLGGMSAVIWTDLIQFLIYIVGAIVATIFIIHDIPGGSETFLSIGNAAGKFQLFNFSIDPAQKYTLWAGILGGAFFTMASHGADQIMVQRYLCSRSLRQARIALVSSGFVVLLQFLLFLLIGVGLFVLAQQRVLELPTGIEGKNDVVFGYFIVNYLPTGIVGLLIAAVLASSMSTLSGSLNSASSSVVADFYRPLRPNMCEAHYLNVARLTTMLWGLSRLAVALAAIQLLANRSVIDGVLSVAGFTTGMILGLFLLGRMRRPVASGSALAGLVAGSLVVLALWLLTSLAWPWYPLVGTVVTVVAALLVDRTYIHHGPSRNRSTEPGLDES